MLPKILDQRPRLSLAVVIPVRILIVDIDKKMLGLMAVYAALCAVFYDPSLSVAWTYAPMMWIRSAMNFDPVHFSAGASSLENCIAIATPLVRKLAEVHDFGVGSILLKLSFTRAILRLVDRQSPFVRVVLQRLRLRIMSSVLLICS
jgi:hypothetical protein